VEIGIAGHILSAKGALGAMIQCSGKAGGTKCL